MKKGKDPFPPPITPRTNTEVTALMAKDSMNMVTMALHNPPLPVSPITARTPLACRMSRTTIMRVSITLSESEIEKYGMPAHSKLVSCVDW